MAGAVEFLNEELAKLDRLKIRNVDDTIFTVALDCWHFSLKALKNLHADKKEKMMDALRLGYTHWFNLVQQTEDDPNKYLQIRPYMYTFGLKVLFDSLTDELPKEKMIVINGTLEKFINENKNNHEMFPDELFLVQTPTEDEIKNALDQADENLLKEFFVTLKDVGVYHNDLSKYDDPEQKKKAIKLYALYTKIMKSK